MTVKPILSVAVILIAVLVVLMIHISANSRPPLAVAIRDSHIRLGKVLLVTNTSEKKLHHLAISITDSNGQKFEGVVASWLDPRATKEIGWQELFYGRKICVPKPGEVCKLYCKGYRKAVSFRIPDE